MFDYKGSKINVILGDITDLETDAIVNPANNTLLGGGGVDGAIHKKGGSIILEQCKKIGGCPTGESRITTAGNLKTNYVIHTVGPKYKGLEIDKKFLYSAYYSSLELSLNYEISSIGFPSISTGSYGYPLEEAVKIAVKATMDFINCNKKIQKIFFVLHNEEDYKIYLKYIKEKLIDFE